MSEELWCGCRQCMRDRGEYRMIGPLKVPLENTRMILCEKCGNKRCPHATDHRHACTGSNEPDQPGSFYSRRRIEMPNAKIRGGEAVPLD